MVFECAQVYESMLELVIMPVLMLLLLLLLRAAALLSPPDNLQLQQLACLHFRIKNSISVAIEQAIVRGVLALLTKAFLFGSLG